MQNNQERMKTIINRLEEEYPRVEVSLDYSNPFELLVATILSAQTTDKMVNSVLPELFDAFPDPQSMANAEPDEIVPLIRSIGLYNNKSKALVGMSQKLVNEYDGKVPRKMKDLLKLPGVGRKTANVVLGNALGVSDSGITVDTHVLRISKRLEFTKSKTAEAVEKDLMEIVPKNYWVDITHLMIAHGRNTCSARKPKCDKCTLSDLCPSAFTFKHFKK